MPTPTTPAAASHPDPDTPAQRGGHLPNRPRVLLRVEEAAQLLAIGRTSMFAYLKTGEIESVKVGRLRRIPLEAITTFITNLATDQAAA